MLFSTTKTHIVINDLNLREGLVHLSRFFDEKVDFIRRFFTNTVGFVVKKSQFSQFFNREN